jgi:hypothetical protein
LRIVFKSNFLFQRQLLLPCFLGEFMSTKNYDAIIIGAGAAGLMCAISAKQKNSRLSVAIIEKNSRVGKKLLATGNGRCNLTNQHISTSRYCGSFVNQSKAIFEKYTTEYLLDIFSSLGLLTYADAEGRYYPICKQASAVLDVLRFACERLGVDICCDESIKSIKKQGSVFCTKTVENEYKSKKLVIACGSKAAPKLGGNASAADYLKNFGHSFVPFSPALCSVKVKSDILKSLKGIRAVCNASLINDKGNVIKSESGEVQFSDTALSGICVFNLSLYSKKAEYISLDLLPDYSFNEVYNILLKQYSLFSEQSADNLFTGILQKRLAQAVMKSAKISDLSRPCSALSKQELKKICEAVKNLRFKITENSGFEQAQCALGGVKGQEIDEKTMQSKITKGLYIAGEAIDICGECGGFNLHFAFSSGHLAGENL